MHAHYTLYVPVYRWLILERFTTAAPRSMYSSAALSDHLLDCVSDIPTDHRSNASNVPISGDTRWVFVWAHTHAMRKYALVPGTICRAKTTLTHGASQVDIISVADSQVSDMTEDSISEAQPVRHLPGALSLQKALHVLVLPRPYLSRHWACRILNT